MFITSKNKYLSNDMKIFGTCSIPLSIYILLYIMEDKHIFNIIQVIDLYVRIEFHGRYLHHSRQRSLEFQHPWRIPLLGFVGFISVGYWPDHPTFFCTACTSLQSHYITMTQFQYILIIFIAQRFATNYAGTQL